MKKTFFVLIILACQWLASTAQTATQVLDRCAALVGNAEGATARFSMSSAQYGEARGTIAIKGNKFHTETPTVSMWFDGTTLWTYMAENDEVNISTPTEQQLQTLNPSSFIHLYRSGFTTTMTTTASTYVVHLTANDPQRRIREAFVTVDKTTYAPKEIKFLQRNRWTTFTISEIQAQRQADGVFRYNSSLHPNAEMIDLR